MTDLTSNNLNNHETHPPSSRHRRAARRRPLNAVVEVMTPRRGKGVTINHSEGGLRVAVDCDLHLDEEIMLHVDELGQPPRLMRCRVAWVRELTDGWIAGLQQLGLH